MVGQAKQMSKVKQKKTPHSHKTSHPEHKKVIYIQKPKTKAKELNGAILKPAHNVMYKKRVN